MNKIRYATLVVICALCVSPVWAEINSENSELMLFQEIPMVLTASKIQESVFDAPTFVSSYKSSDLETLGYYTLSELANITPGYSSFHLYGEEVFETRGQKAGSWNNNKHLLFIDGIPVNFARNYKANTTEELPLFFADQVEFLRGPASCLYGASAFFGVISILPKELKNNGFLSEQKISLGDNQNSRRIMSNILNKTDRGQSKISLGYYSKEASKAYTGPFPDTTGSNYLYDDQKSLFLYGTHEIAEGPLSGLAPGLIIMSKTFGMGEFWNGVHGGDNEMNEVLWEQIIPFVKYKKDLGPAGLLDGYIKSNRSEEKGLYSDSTNPKGYGNYDSFTNDLEALLEINTPLLEKWSLINGMNFDIRKERIFENDALQATSGIAGNVETYSWYTQLRMELSQLLNGTILTAGARYDYGLAGTASDRRYSKISPRLSLVQRLSGNWTIRASYGEAIRAPGIKEIGLNAESQPYVPVTLPDLKPETISSIEGGVSYTDKYYYSSLTVFKNRTRDPLDGVPVTDNNGLPRNTFHNSAATVDANGLEWENRYSPLEELHLLFNVAYAKAVDQDSNAMTDTPLLKANVAVTYELKTPLQLQCTLIDRWLQKYTISDNSTYPGYNLVDANIVAPVMQNLSFELQVRNLADVDYKLPQGGIANVPVPRRTFIGSANIRF